MSSFLDASAINENREDILSVKFNTHNQILRALKKYLEIKNILYRIDMVFDADRILVKETQCGLIAKMYRSKADILVYASYESIFLSFLFHSE